MIKFRGHTLVIGATGAGKGVLVASQARAWMAAGMNVYLLCNKPDEYEDFPANFKTMDQARLLEEVKKLKAPEKGFVDTMVVIDEAWDWDWKKKDTGLQLIANAGRAYGVEMWVQSQFPSQMAPTVRANCQNRFVFLLDEPNAIDWVARCLGAKFRECATLPPGRYLCKRGLGEPFYGTAWYEDLSGKWVGV